MTSEAMQRPLPSRHTILALVVGPLYALGAAAVVVLSLGLPHVDAYVNPVLKDQVALGVTYDTAERKLCWTSEFTKAIDAKAVRVAFQVEDRDGDRASLSPYRLDTGNAFDARAPTRKPGRHRIPLCALMPEGIESPWIVSGYIDYDTGRWFWTTRANFPPIAPLEGKYTTGSGS